MSKIELKSTKIEGLSVEIIKHRDLYYNDQPIIDDAAFDILCDELRKLDPENKALTEIGASVDNSEWKKAEHKIICGSLDKVNTPEELKDWALKIFKPRNSIFVTEKIDGLSVEVVYENGELTQGISRGNGKIGDLITRNVVKMRGVKKYIPGLTASLRGEIVLTRTNHKKYFQEYSNPRNAASGITRRINGEGCEHLDIQFYQIVGDTKSLSGGDFRSEFQQFEFIRSLGLNTPNYDAFVGSNGKNDIGELCDRVSKRWEEYQTTIRDSLDTDVDGLVVRINDIEDQLALGEHHNRPKAAIAFKFPNQFASTHVKSIVWATGHSGRITPVCWFDKTNLQGSNIEKASVYNIAYIKELGLGVGAEVLVCKSGEIIPRVEKVLKPGLTTAIPTQCPTCSGPVEMQGENLVCVSTDTCNAMIKGRISTWLNTLNILEWGDRLIERLVESGKVNTIPDLYKLSVEDLMSIERMGAKSAEKCFNLLWEKPAIPLEILLGSLSIPLVAVSTIEMVIAAGYDTLEKILMLKEEQFRCIKGLGPVKAASLYKGLNRNRDLIFDLLKQGIGIKENNEMSDVSNGNSGKLVNLVFTFTGAMEHKRKYLEEVVVENGGTVNSSVRKTNTHLVVADVSKQSVKTKAAIALGVKLISENDFLCMCE